MLASVFLSFLPFALKAEYSAILFKPSGEKAVSEFFFFFVETRIRCQSIVPNFDLETFEEVGVGIGEGPGIGRARGRDSQVQTNERHSLVVGCLYEISPCLRKLDY